MSPFFLCILLFLLSFGAFSMHIYSQPSFLTYQNPFVCSLCFKVVMTVLFETPLMTNEYVSVTFPMAFPSTGITASISSTFFTQQGEFTFPITSSSGTNFILQANANIPSNVWINITFYSKDESAFTTGIHGCIQMQTMSSTTNGIIYDSNSCLDIIGLAPPVVSTGFTVVGSYATADANNWNVIGKTYRAYFDVTPNIDLEKGAILILTQAGRFSFDYPCLNLACTAGATDCTQNISLLNSTTSCLIKNNIYTQNELHFQINQNLNQSQTFRIAVSIVSPSYYVSHFEADTIEASLQSTGEPGFLQGYLSTVTPNTNNPLSLYNAYPTVTMTNTAKLFWGLLPQTDTSKDGCPLTYYATASYIPIYNSLRTEFTLSTAILAYTDNGFLLVKWRTINPGGGYTAVIFNSFATNLPQSSNGFGLSYSNDELTLQNVNSLQASQTYYLSIKFAVTSNAVGQTITAGYLEIRTGTTGGWGEDLIVSLDGPNMPVRLNREYLDTSTTTSWFYDAPPKNYYNLLYSYKNSDYSLTGTLSTVYTSITNAFFSTTSKVGVFVKPPSSSDTYNLFVILYAGPNKICKNGFLDPISKCVSSGNNNGLHILLKLIFNNNILGIDSSLFSNGVLLVGTLFADSTGANSGSNNYAAGTSSRLNLITSTTDASGGVFYHVSLICQQAALAVDYCHQILGRSTTTVSGLAFLNTNIATLPTLYADTNVFDMILCFKCLPYNNFIGYNSIIESFFTLYEDNTNLGGPGIFHGYVITDGPPSGSFGTYANYYYDGTTYGNSNYIASYLRVSITFDSSLPASGTFLGVFLYDNNLAGLQHFSDNNNNINCVEMVSGTQVTGSLLSGSYGTAAVPDFWWQHNTIVLAKSILTSTQYNFYIPLLISSNKIRSLYVAVLNKNSNAFSQYQFQAIYRIIGSAFGATLTKTFSSFNTLSPFTTLSANFGNDNTNGCATSGTIPQINPGTSFIKPYNSIANMGFTSDLGKIGSGYACALGLNSGNNWGAIFSIYSRTNIFSTAQTFTWDYAGSNINKCVFYPITDPSNKVGFIYTILCGLDSDSSVSSIGTGKNVYIEKFVVPFYWGATYAIANNLQYVWSLPSGLGVSMTRDPTVTTSWFEDLCQVVAVSNIPINTKDVFYSLSIKNVAKYDLPAGDNNLMIEETIITGLASLNFVACQAHNLGCTYSTAAKFTLSNPSSTSVYSILPNSINIYVLVDTPPTFTATTHSATITYETLVTEQCSQSTPTGFTLSANQITNDVILSSLQYIQMVNARGAFSFSFSLSRNLRSGNAFYFNLGFLSTGLTNAGIYQCYILDSTQNKSHLFSSIDTSDLTTVKTVLKSDITGGGTFSFKCSGGAQSPDNSAQTAVSASYVRVSDGIVITSTNLDSEKLAYVAIPVEKKLSTISLSKMFATTGMDSDYVFLFKPGVSDITESGRIYVEFSQIISPRFNQFGLVECYLNDIVVYCESISERRLSVTPNILLTTSSTSSYKLLVSGITQPNAKDSNWQVYFALDINSNAYDGISEHAYINDQGLDSSTTLALSNIFLWDMILNPQVLRESLSIELHVLLPANSINTGNQLYVQLPRSFRESFQLGDQLTCSVKNMNDLNTELSSSCNKYFNLKIMISVSDSVNIVDSNYTIKLTGLISPQETTIYNKPDIRIFLTKDNVTVQAASISCLRNTTEFLVFLSASTNSSLTELDFFDSNLNNLASLDHIDVYQGSYRTIIGLGPLTDNFASTFKWSFTNPTNAKFYTFPPNIEIEVGSPASFFAIAADNQTVPGLYLLTAQKFNGTGSSYSSIPAIEIRVRNEPYQILLSQTVYYVPYGGRSVPIVIDFSNCLPIQEVEVTANVTYGYNNYFISMEGLQQKTKKLVFSSSNTQKQIYFYATSYSQNVLSGSPIALISFTIGGNNSYAYLPPATIQIQVIDNTQFLTPPNSMTPFVNPGVGTTTFIVSCDQMGTLYYEIGINNSTINDDYSIMQNNSENVMMAQTFPASNDVFYKIYGYQIVNAGNNQISFPVVNKLKSDATYMIRAICLNLASIPSSYAGNATWIQPTNGGKKFKLQFKFNGSLSDLLKVDIACAFSNYFKVNPERVLTDQGDICQVNNNNNNRRILQSANSTNTTDTTNTTNTTNTSSSNNTNSSSSNTSNSSSAIIKPSTYNYSWYFAQNYTSDSDNLYNSVSAAFAQDGFFSSILALTSSGASAFPILLNSSLVDLSNISNTTTPLVYSTMITTANSYISLSLAITNTFGYIYIGLGKNITTPSATQLKLGLDGNNSPLISFNYAFVQTNVSQTFNFTNLTNHTLFYLYYVASNDDMTLDGLTSTVIGRTVYTFGERNHIVRFGILLIIAVFIFGF